MIDKDWAVGLERGARSALDQIRREQSNLALKEQYWQGWADCTAEVRRKLAEDDSESPER